MRWKLWRVSFAKAIKVDKTYIVVFWTQFLNKNTHIRNMFFTKTFSLLGLIILNILQKILAIMCFLSSNTTFYFKNFIIMNIKKIWLKNLYKFPIHFPTFLLNYTSFGHNLFSSKMLKDKTLPLGRARKNCLFHIWRTINLHVVGISTLNFWLDCTWSI